MSKYFSILSKKVGKPPGTLLHIGENPEEDAYLEFLSYNDEECIEKRVDTDHLSVIPTKTGKTNWFNFIGVHDTNLVKQIGEYLGFHNLTLEDIMNTQHRPKYENLDDHIFLIIKMLQYDSDEKLLISEQISFILKQDIVVSFQERTGDVFDPIRERIRNSSGRIRTRKADYLFYALTDVIVDNYFLIFEEIEDQIQDIEDELLTNPNENDQIKIQKIQKDIITIRKAIVPLNNAFITLMNDEPDLIEKDTRRFLKDIFDHINFLTDRIESFTDTINTLKDIYMSSISLKMNNVMKVLTVIATIFIPLTFIAGIYGMNFSYMPELQWKWGYFAILGLMFVVIIVMLIFFKIKKWF
jgi:magnesium transporter